HSAARNTSSSTYIPCLHLLLFLSLSLRPPPSTLFPYTTLFRSVGDRGVILDEKYPDHFFPSANSMTWCQTSSACMRRHIPTSRQDRKSTRLNSSHVSISYAVFCLKKKINQIRTVALDSNWHIYQ